MKRRARLAKKSQSPTAQAKDRIQGLLREIAILRDNGCFARLYPEMGPCGPYRKDGELILQYDHLNSRTRNISYGDSRLGVCVCPNHHYHHHNNMRATHLETWNRYLKNARHFIGPANAKLLDKVLADQRIYPMGLSDWLKVEAALTVELRELERRVA